MNSSGKVLVIFLVITAILLVSLTAISLFFFQKETERRKLVEATLERYEMEKTKLAENLEEAKKENFLLQEKNKESEERVNDLSDELELEKGLREEIKLEKTALEEKLKALEKEKQDFSKTVEENNALTQKLNKEMATSAQKIKELESKLEAEKERNQKLGELYEQKQEESKIQSKRQEEQRVQAPETVPNVTATDGGGIELEEIVVAPNGRAQMPVNELSQGFDRRQAAVLDSVLNGRILSVDTETEFVIVSLGEKDGLSVGNVLSVYRNDDYVGDIKITRLQSEMSAADLIQPLSIRNVRKNDLVKTK